MSSSAQIKSGFSTVRLVVDKSTEETVPVGLIGWDSSREWYGVRLLEGEEKVSGVTKRKRRFLKLAESQFRTWAEKGRAPYSERERPPWDGEFWEDVSEVLTTAVRVDPPKALDPRITSREEFESLFDALVSPDVPEGERQTRIDGLVRRALGELSHSLDYHEEVRAFGGVREPVLRGFSGKSGTVIVEGVNLAGRYARRDADAVVSKLLRIREGQNGKPLYAIIGYRASPGGLNGEGHMRDWIAEKATEKVYDLERQTEQFHEATEMAVKEVSAQEHLRLED